MAKKHYDLKRYLAPADSILIFVIVLGLIIAIFLSEQAIQLMGISITALGVVFLAVRVSQRLKYFELRNFAGDTPPMTSVKQNDEKAKRQIFTDYDNYFGDKADQDEEETGQVKLKDSGTTFESTIDSFKSRLQKFGKKAENKAKETYKKAKPKYATPIQDSSVNQMNGDTFSGMRVIGVKKKEDDVKAAVVSETVKPAIISKPAPVVEKSEPKPVEKQVAPIPDVKPSIETSAKTPEIRQAIPERKIEPALPNKIIFEDDDVFDNDELLDELHKVPTKPVVEVKVEEKVVVPTYKPEVKANTETAERQQVPEPVNVRDHLPIAKPYEKPLTEKQVELPTVEKPVDKPPVEKPVEKPPAPFKKKTLDIPLSTLINDVPAHGLEPRKEFQDFLGRVLMVIRSVIASNTTSFFLVNQEKQELILEAYISESPDMITSKVKFPIGNDVVSQIVMNVRPEILTEINPAAELDLIPYYTENSGITSFIGVPVFYDDTVMGVLCADTTVTDAYDIRTVGFFGHFTKLIAALVESYIEKYDLSQADRTLSAITNFRRILANKELTINEINESIIESASELIEYSTIGSCCFDDATGDWRITAFKQKHDSDYSLLNKVVQLDSTLIGEAILSARTLYIAPFNDNLARVHPDEENITGGFFAAVPLKSLSNVYGAIFIESKLPLSITSNDLATLEALAENAGSSVEQVMMNHFMQTSSMIDIKTGILTPNALFQRIDEELSRSIDFNGNICLCTFRIDKYASFDPKAFTERMERATVHVIGIIKKHLRYYDIFGKVDENTFGIVLIGMDVQAAKLWAERLRSEIAISILEIMSQRFTLTISMGIASSLGVDSIEVLMNNTRKSLEISVKKGNTVTVF